MNRCGVNKTKHLLESASKLISRRSAQLNSYFRSVACNTCECNCFVFTTFTMDDFEGIFLLFRKTRVYTVEVRVMICGWWCVYTVEVRVMIFGWWRVYTVAVRVMIFGWWCVYTVEVRVMIFGWWCVYTVGVLVMVFGWWCVFIYHMFT